MEKAAAIGIEDPVVSEMVSGKMGLLFILTLGDWTGRHNILGNTSTYFQLPTFSNQPEWRINGLSNNPISTDKVVNLQLR
ncbi:unnamed protein product [Schistosoma rodhaini]|uniref:Uncharacterized protein n=1 Tax=Schistosoma rodhaini TaxID=6188 RepID=A0AA85GLI7_9TREM|nr:unnamed protein product [Schistosoma rodhaini]